MVEIAQSPGIFWGYPNQFDTGRQGREIVAIAYHTMDGYWSFYQSIILGKAAGFRNCANYSLDLDGTIRQHVADENAAWCNGLDWSKGGPAAHKSDLKLPWLADAYARRISPNCYTINIEIAGESGAPLTAHQYTSLIAWTKLMRERHPKISLDRIGLVGHYQIDGINKQGCPGSAFPWTSLLEDLRAAPPAPTPQAGLYTAASTDTKGLAIGVHFAAFLNSKSSTYPKPRLFVAVPLTGDSYLYLVGLGILFYRAWKDEVREVWA